MFLPMDINMFVMPADDPSGIDTECAILWKLARTHGWSTEVSVSDLVRDANVLDEKQWT